MTLMILFSCSSGPISDPCSSEPCQNAGVCSHIGSGSTEYICACHAGFSGINCETKSKTHNMKQ